MRLARTLLFLSVLLVAFQARHVQAAVLWGLDTTPDRLFTLDTSNGNVTNIGVLPAFNFGGLDFDGSGNLYALLDSSLYSVNPGTAAATLIGTAAGRVFESFEIIGGVGYSADVFNESLYSINLATGQATLIGS